MTIYYKFCCNGTASTGYRIQNVTPPQKYKVIKMLIGENYIWMEDLHRTLLPTILSRTGPSNKYALSMSFALQNASKWWHYLLYSVKNRAFCLILRYIDQKNAIWWRRELYIDDASPAIIEQIMFAEILSFSQTWKLLEITSGALESEFVWWIGLQSLHSVCTPVV